MKNNKPLTPKQRERLAKEARQRNAARPAAVAVAPKPAMSRGAKCFVTLVALLLVFATTASVLFGFCFSKWRVDPTASAFEDLSFKEYLMLEEMGDNFYVDKKIDLSAIYAAYGKKVTEEDVDEYIRQLLFANRKEIALSQKTTPIGEGDDVYYYVIGVKDAAGNAILTNDFAATKYSLGVLTVGKAVFGEDFDKVITGKVPYPATSLTTGHYGTLTGNEVVIITLNAYKGEAKKNPTSEAPEGKYTFGTNPEKTIGSGRLDISTLDDRLKAALVENITVGEDVVFYLENYAINPNDSADPAACVRFEVRVDAIVTEERTMDVTFKLPDNYFSGDDNNDLSKLNGTDVTFSMIIPYTNDYELPTLTKSFITETLGFETDAATDAAAVAAFKEAKLAEMEESRKEILHKSCISQIVKQLAEQTVTGVSGKASQIFIENEYSTDPADPAYNKKYTAAINEAYEMLVEEFRSSYGRAPSSDELSSYAQNSYGGTVDAVVLSNFKQTLFMYYIFADAGLKITDAELDAAYEEHLDALVESVGDEELYGREYFLRVYTEDGLRKQAKKNLIYDVVGEYLLAHNELITEAE